MNHPNYAVHGAEDKLVIETYIRPALQLESHQQNLEERTDQLVSL